MEFIDEQTLGNRTLQRLRILLNNFDVDDSTYVCLISSCPILVEQANDTYRLNVTLASFSHGFLSVIYRSFDDAFLSCTIQTRFIMVTSNTSSLTCTRQVYLHPHYINYVSSEILLDNCRLRSAIDRLQIEFHRSYKLTNNNEHNLTITSSNRTCQWLVKHIGMIPLRMTHEHIDHVWTTATLMSITWHVWPLTTMTFEPCRTQLIQFRKMFFTDDIARLRRIHIEQERTIEIQCKTLPSRLTMRIR
jgi:hypothetical protein